ncbi:RTA1 like protein-domain-containing protein [Annulohypoxylon maeteangense]|uniref:RTA1 like protein-domain-containing protein n=1 Tax=Annulohypoxylon maeteangense TaxID=1927788 RepID=UPI002008C056|nr:RTA1 like protein-domain-containing protein [Annulohypoxylon maeteangense]KAI0881597.1 RTA1 like protein-domain-containing protein [Annulohypoxylon maeteangense]
MVYQLLVASVVQLVTRDDDDDAGDNDGPRDCITATPGPNGNVPTYACNSYYNFDPQFAPAVAVAVLFGVLTGAHIVEAIIFRKRYMWVLIMGGIWETVAFILHSLGARNQQNVGYATAWQILFLLAPLWINASVYMTFARLSWFFLPDQRIGGIKPASIAKYFVWADVLTFLVQGVGGTMASPTASPNIIKIGLDIYLSGMGLQQFFIMLFLVLMVIFHRRAQASPPEVVSETGEKKPGWKPLLIALYVVLALITIRNMYRIAEFAGGITPSNPVPSHEEYSYSLDCFPMMLALLILAIWHPGRTLVGPASEFPHKSRVEKKREKQERKAAKKQAKFDKKWPKSSQDAPLPGHIDEPVELTRYHYDTLAR